MSLFVEIEIGRKDLPTFYTEEDKWFRNMARRQWEVLFYKANPLIKTDENTLLTPEEFNDKLYFPEKHKDIKDFKENDLIFAAYNNNRIKLFCI